MSDRVSERSWLRLIITLFARPDMEVLIDDGALESKQSLGAEHCHGLVLRPERHSGCPRTE